MSSQQYPEDLPATSPVHEARNRTLKEFRRVDGLIKNAAKNLTAAGSEGSVVHDDG
jgi:hypothetical protein